MTYRRKGVQQYRFRRPRGWILGYQCRGKYTIWGLRSRRLPKSVEFVDLVVPPQEAAEIPLGCEVKRLGKGENLIVKVPRDKLNMFRIAGVDDSEIEEIMKGVRRRRGKRKPTEFDRQIGIIRKALKKLCPSLSVRRERGTGYGWIDIRGSGKWGDFTEAEKKALERFGLPHGANSAGISPESRKYYVKRAEEILKELGE